MSDVQKLTKIDEIRASIECDIEDIDTALEVLGKYLTDSLEENDDMYSVMDKLEAYRTGLQTSLAYVSGGKE